MLAVADSARRQDARRRAAKSTFRAPIVTAAHRSFRRGGAADRATP
jgi:hypothetical protein